MTPPHRPRTAAPRPLHLLLVEDCESQRVLATAILGAAGHQLEIAVDGARAAWLVTQEQREFDAILMDLEMPVMDGIETAERIRRWEAERGRRTPILAMTAHSPHGIEKRCRAAGIDGYVAKPIDASAVRRELDLLERRPADVARPPITNARR